MARVKIYSRVFNVKLYLEQCISSVLAQTFKDFEFFVIDNGCTDGSSEIIDAFAAKDTRVHVIRFEKNTNVVESLYRIIQRTAEGYVTIIDSDDWWEPDYLEKLLHFAEENRLDIACTGTCMHHMDSGEQSYRSLEEPLVFEKEEMAHFFPLYHVFFRTYWAKLFRAEILPQEGFEKLLGYGGDTLYSFDALRISRRMGIDSSVLHHYRLHKKSISNSYNYKRFSMDVSLYEDAILFLKSYGAISSENYRFLRVVFSNAVLDTVYTLHNSKLLPKEKAKEFRRITEHPFTIDAYRNEKNTLQSHREVVRIGLEIGKQLTAEEFGDMQAAFCVWFPRCGRCVTANNIPLFCAEKTLLGALIQDDRDTLASAILSFIQARAYTKQYDMGHMLATLAEEIPLLNGVEDTIFMRKYVDIYRMLWQGHTVEALDGMTGLLLEDRVHGAKEIFLQIYLKAAAQLEEVSAFIFGNVKLAEFYFHQNRLNECRAVLDDLEEMGVEETEEISILRRNLDRTSHTS